MGSRPQVQRLTERVESVEEHTSAVFGGYEGGAPSEFSRMQQRLAMLEAEVGGSRQREAEWRESNAGMLKLVDAMRSRVEVSDTWHTEEGCLLLLLGLEGHHVLARRRCLKATMCLPKVAA